MSMTFLTPLVPRVLVSKPSTVVGVRGAGGGGSNGPPGISRTTNVTDLKPWEMLGVSFKVKKMQVDTSSLHNAKVPRHQYEVILTVKLSRTGFLFACGRLK